MPGQPKTQAAKRRRGQWDPVKTIPPEKVGELLADLIADPDETMAALAERHGLGRATVEAFIQALRTTHVAMYETAREVSASELLPMIDTRLKQALQFMSPEKMAAASVRDLAVTAGILAEKRALMRGEPTQILAVDDRKKLHEMWPVIMREVARRGMTVEGDFRDMTEADAQGLDPETRVISEDPVTDYVPNRAKRGARARPALLVKDGDPVLMKHPDR
jgi:hypothetical protein